MGFIYRFITFFAIFGLLVYLIVGILEFSVDLYRNSDISVLHEIRENRSYDTLLMGTSHARMLGISGHKKDVQDILGKKILLLANNGSGILPQKLYLEIFYEDYNKADTIVYFIDPWVFYSKDWNENNYYITDEVFRFDYLTKIIANKFSGSVVKEYLRKKLSYKLFIYPIPRSIVHLDSINDKDYSGLKEFQKERVKLWYPQGTDKQNFERYSHELEKIIILAKKNNTKVVFILPPSLLSELPGQKEVTSYMNTLTKKYGVSFHDYSKTVTDRSMYLNADHLNKKGALYFTKEYLLKIL